MIGIICGGGDYPKLIIESCQASGIEFCLILLRGFADDICYKNSIVVQFGEVDKSLNFLRKNSVNRIVFAGYVRRPNFHTLALDKTAKKWLARLGKNIFAGDDRLLRSVSELFAAEGFDLIAGTEFIKQNFLNEGIFSNKTPTELEWQWIKTGFKEATTLGLQDVGQGVVVFDNKIIARENINGTDFMINADHPVGSILVKVSKPQQDQRLDLPTIGPDTIENLHKHNFSGIAIESDRCIVLHKDMVINLANKYNIFLISMRREIKIFISAGEASGDYLGGMLMQNIRKNVSKYNVDFFGIGGHNMLSAGLRPLFAIDQLSIIGIWEAIKQIIRVKKMISQTVKAIIEYDPDIVVTIDSSGFHYRVNRKLKKYGYRKSIVHYVAPPVWAWRKWRVKTLHKFMDKLLAMLPFEKKIFDAYIDTEFVGHPIAVDTDFNAPNESNLLNFKKAHKLLESNIITILPGSRPSELKKHLPILRDFVSLLFNQMPNTKIIIPTIDDLSDQIKDYVRNWSITPLIVTKKGEKILAYYSSHVAIAASGTVTLELARVGLPSVLIYKTSLLTYKIVKALIQISHVGLVNIIAKKNVIPELLQDKCTPENILIELNKILQSNNRSMLNAYIDVINQLKMNETTAAEAITKLLRLKLV